MTYDVINYSSGILSGALDVAHYVVWRAVKTVRQKRTKKLKKNLTFPLFCFVFIVFRFINGKIKIFERYKYIIFYLIMQIHAQ